jgi:hypothetical protein
VGGPAGNYYYVAIQINFPTAGHYDITSNSMIDTYGYLYDGSFDPANPSVNLRWQHDDSNGQFQFLFGMTIGSRYTLTLVTTTYSAGVTGAFSVVVTGPAAVTFTPISAPAPLQGE